MAAAKTKEANAGGATIQHTMNHLQPSRSVLRHFTLLARRTCLHSQSFTRTVPTPAPWRIATYPVSHQVGNGLLSTRPFSHSVASRQDVIAPQITQRQESQADQPAYEMTFTCKKCSTRSSHRTVLITCPGCKNRHLIADHLKVDLCSICVEMSPLICLDILG